MCNHETPAITLSLYYQNHKGVRASQGQMWTQGHGRTGKRTHIAPEERNCSDKDTHG